VLLDAGLVGTLTSNSIARLIAYVATAFTAFIYAAVTARWLGPAGKGILATLTFLFAMFCQLACLGLGEAATVLVGQKRLSIQKALSATTGTLAVTCVVAMAGLGGVASVTFRPDLTAIWLSIAAACVGVPIFASATVLAQFVNLRERFIETSIVHFAQGAVTAAATVALVVLWPQSVFGAVLAVVIGSTVALIAVVHFLKQRGLSLRPAWDVNFLRRALPYGVRVQISGPPPITDRVDLLLVYALGGQAAAGRYSIALTLGAVAGFAPLALSHVSFPRLARLSGSEALALTSRSCRYGVGAALIVAIGLSLAIPFGTRLVFGEPYAPAIVPALVLLAGYVLSSAQWILVRALAARGNARVILWSYGVNLGIMVALDFALLPVMGVTGAAIASTFGAAFGLLACLGPYREPGRPLLGLGEFVPTSADFRHLVMLPAILFRDRKSRREGSSASKEPTKRSS
jgi:O-antigen/teichoic acid export membrane protein